ncbi:MAG: diversity-generating retroelement protein Avd [Chloroflexota bacterium]|nr:diversity-generating retroelement protein Avd [Chloroflexota bacterium]
MKQSPIFSKTYDLVKWLIPATVKFPRQQRFVLAQAIQQDALRFQGLLIEAVHSSRPANKLAAADAELDKLRTHIRLARDLGLLSPGQYQHVAKMLTEVGKLIGGWKKSLSRS